MTAWSRRFETPIALQGGRVLVTLRDAGMYIAALGPVAQRRQDWRLATEMLLKAAEQGWPVMMASIALLKAVHVDEPPPQRAARHARKYRILR